METKTNNSKQSKNSKSGQNSYPNLVLTSDNYSTLENSLVIISKKEEYENDKFRIKKKFNFVNNSNTQSQPNIAVQTPSSMLISPLKKKYKSNTGSKASLHNQIISKNWLKNGSVESQKKEEEESLIIPVEPTMNSIPASQRTTSSKNSDVKTEKETRDCLMNDIQRNNCNIIIKKQSDLFTSKDDSVRENEEEEINIIDEIEHLHKINKEEHEVETPIINDISNNNPNEVVSNVTSNMNSIFCSRYNSILFTKNPNLGLNPLFRQSCSYNLSSRLVNDENSNNSFKHYTQTEKKFRFIHEIVELNEEKNKKHEKNKILYEKLLSMNNNTFYFLLFFIYDEFDKYYILNKAFKNKIKTCLNDKHKQLLEDFKEKYKNVLEMINVNYKSKTFIQYNNNDTIPLFDMILTCKILPVKHQYSSYTIAYTLNHLKSSKIFTNIFKFDIRPMNKHLLWFSSEIEEYNYSYKRFCYTQNISSFSEGDSIQFKIGLFSPVGMVDVKNLKWSDLEVSTDIQKELYEKKQKKNEILYDKFRSCEIENIIHLWKTAKNIFMDSNQTNKGCQNEDSKISKLLQHKQILFSFIELFKKYFEITGIFYDISKFFYFKIKMTANKVGHMDKNTFMNTGIDILPRKSQIINECHSLYVLNYNTLRDNYQIREGTNIIFYITDI